MSREATRGESRLVRWAWLPLNAVGAVYLCVWTAFWITAALVVRQLTRSPRIPLRMARTLWAPGLTGPGGYRIRVENRGDVDLDRPCLFAANHRSFLDIPVLFRALPTELRFVVKAELARVPFLGAYIRAMGMVFVERGRGTRAAQGIGRVGEILSGSSVVAFPEGTRSRDGRLLPFRTGALAKAIEVGAPIVPVAILGTEKGLPRDGFRPRPARIRVILGDPIPTTDRDPSERREIAALVRTRVIELIAAAGDDAGAERPAD